MQYAVIIQPVAEEELEQAYLYIREDSPERAARWRKRMLGRARSLKRWPQRCPIAPENDAFPVEIRHLVVGNYRFLFTIVEATREVHVVHVRHAKQRAVDPGGDGE